MTNDERVATGLAGKVAGKAKAAAGAVVGNEVLEREGRLQEAASDAGRLKAEQVAEVRAAQEKGVAR